MTITKPGQSAIHKRPGLKSRLAQSFPRLAMVSRIIRGNDLTFSGWGMTTSTTMPPWVNIFPGSELQNAADFLETDTAVRKLVKSDKFKLSQFQATDLTVQLDGLMWRHYVVFWSAMHAVKNTSVPVKNLVECGVCDGLTVYYAMSAAKSLGVDFRSFLYDAWAPMDGGRLLDAERVQAGDYHYLSMESTQANLRDFATHSTFNKGFIPDSFTSGKNPDSVVWLHIDLNSAKPTRDALDYFYDRMVPGGVFLFDDYAHRGYEDTKHVVDDFFAGKNAHVLHMPTGQAVVFKGR